jgi:malate dehydrogenase (oxaloacetate-decarboxylating)(NADP+)
LPPKLVSSVNIFFFTFFHLSGHTLLRDKRHNKGLAFTENERDSHYLRGLLPPAIASQELQVYGVQHFIFACLTVKCMYMQKEMFLSMSNLLFWKSLRCVLYCTAWSIALFTHVYTICKTCQFYIAFLGYFYISLFIRSMF